MTLPDSLGYGADYNPEQWPAEIIDEDVRLMRAAGMNLVAVGIFSWSKIEPREGEFHFDWLDVLLDKLHAAGIRVSLATATASPPPWVGHTYPDTLPIDAQGRTLYWGSRQQYNPSSATFRRLVTRLVRAIAERYRDHPALALWHVHNEYGCHVAESFDEESAAAFRTWLQRRYGDIDELNRVWGTSFWSQGYTDWEQVIPPRPTPTFANPLQLLDWRRFSSDALLDLYLAEVEILREVTPDVPLTTNFMGLFRPLDYWRWAEHIDVISNDSYPDPSDPRAAAGFALDSDLMRSLGGGRPFIQMEQTTAQVQWRPRNAVKRPGQFALWSLQAVARGADAICQFQWRQSIAGAETFHGAMLPHAGTDSPVWGEVTALGRSLAALDRVVGARVPARVALLWDWQSAWAREYAIGPTDTDPAQSLRDWHSTFYEHNVPVDLLPPHGDLDGYDLIVVPSLFLVDDATAERLSAAAERGASVVVDHFTGVVDADAHAYQGGYLGPLAPLLGVRVLEVSPAAVTPQAGGSQRADGAGEPIEDLTASEPWVSPISSAVRAVGAERRIPLESTLPGVTAGLEWAETLAVDEATIVATFARTDHDARPAITRRSHGAGHAWYVATRLDAASRLALIRGLGEHGVIDVPDVVHGVEQVRRGDVTFYLNHGDDSRAVPATGTDLLTGARITDTLTLAPRGAAVVHPLDEESS